MAADYIQYRRHALVGDGPLDYSHWDKRIPAYGADGALLTHIGFAWMINSIALTTARQP
ncbi:hypothetical protein [Streptomyces sp. TRM68367]|uniref:hypothetical protein n=1 Tax=Streptomyces sp. TRM68367 TaxID=2758415 RepID=UPI00165A635B|nr:hypothetical protein [Streptomyces sp. TRM68367]MBC9730445.1 hypothetical protein [Streptomyces sp. TRM68367]